MRSLSPLVSGIVGAGLIALSGGCMESLASKADFVSKEPRLTARPSRSVTNALTPGIHRPTARNTELVVYMPPSAVGRAEVPVVLFLHGALRTVEEFVEGHRALADSNGVLVVAPYAVFGTWDAIHADFGADVVGIDDALTWVFQRVPVDSTGVLISGFSDGATYALAIGRANGDLFSRIVAYSPGFIRDIPQAIGRPPILISHGTQDAVLPYDYTVSGIVPGLINMGYAVSFRSFDGPHAVPRSVLAEVMRAHGTPRGP